MSDNEYAIQRLHAIRSRIAQAAKKAGREPAEITLVGAAKQQPAALAQKFVDAGLQDIGENYLQEGISKQQQVAGQALTWHYIGSIQSNKTASIAEYFTWVHSVDRLKIAKRLAAQSPTGSQLNILLQIDIDNEPSKGGAAVREVPTLCAAIAQLSGVRLRGFMVLPKLRRDHHAQREPFAQTRELMNSCNQQTGLEMDTLSMGMSGDLEAAILEGSTMVRIGTDLFGVRA